MKKGEERRQHPHRPSNITTPKCRWQGFLQVRSLAHKLFHEAHCLTASWLSGCGEGCAPSVNSRKFAYPAEGQFYPRTAAWCGVRCNSTFVTFRPSSSGWEALGSNESSLPSLGRYTAEFLTTALLDRLQDSGSKRVDKCFQATLLSFEASLPPTTSILQA